MRWMWLGCLAAVLGVGLTAMATGSNDHPSGASSLDLNAVTDGTVFYPDDRVDWWRIYVRGPGTLVVFLDGYQARDIDLFFYNSNLDLLAQSIGSGEDEVVFGQVSGGWYYIRVETAYSVSASTDYDIGALFVTSSTGYLREDRDVNLHRLYMAANQVYWIFLVDNDGFFDPDLFLGYGDDVLARSQFTGNIDVIKWYPGFSGSYLVAVGSAQGSGHYYILVGSRLR